MKHESVKKSLDRSKNVLEQKGKNSLAKKLHKNTNKLTTIATNLVREQLNRKRPNLSKTMHEFKNMKTESN